MSLDPPRLDPVPVERPSWLDLDIGSCLHPSVVVTPQPHEQGQCVLCAHLGVEGGNDDQIAVILGLIIDQIEREYRGEHLTKSCSFHQLRSFGPPGGD